MLLKSGESRRLVSASTNDAWGRWHIVWRIVFSKKFGAKHMLSHPSTF
jgi:hypothetical protein